MKVTLDTNVLVSAFISKQGNPSHILDIITTFDEISLVLSSEILAECKDVLRRNEVARRFQYSSEDIEEFIEAVRAIAMIVDIRSNFKIVKDDPKDDMILNTAFDGKVDFLISGDRHLKDIKAFRGISIVSPKQFSSIVARRFGELISQ